MNPTSKCVYTEMIIYIYIYKVCLQRAHWAFEGYKHLVGAFIKGAKQLLFWRGF